MSYTHLHLHTEYSLLDGANKLEKLAARVKELGMTSVSMTDHGNMFGAVDFYYTMKKAGIKPIVGIEAYLHNEDDLGSKETKQRFHLCLYAKNEEGYKNLMYLSSMSFIKGFYYFPRINKKLLREHSAGLVASSACLQGEVSWHLNTNNPRNVRFGAKGYEVAKEVALEYRDIFGDDFYLEIMRHGIGDQRFIDEQLIRLSKETGIKLIATNDTHYTRKEDAGAQEVAMCVAMGKTLDDENRLKHSVKEFYVKSPQEMQKLFADIPEALAHTQEIADKCNLVIDLKDDKNPPTPPAFIFTKEYASREGLDMENDAEYFAYKAREGLEERLKIVPQEKHQAYRDRLEEEIGVITQMRFPGYMLIVWDFINFAKENKIPVGPGRGSAAGSLVAFCLKITDIDPMKYDLLFERFLNPERVSMPDIDTDFCQRRRGEVIDYMIKKYGQYNVAQVITFGKLLAKGVIRDVARVLNIPISQADAITKLIPATMPDEKKGTKPATLEYALGKEPKIKELLAKTEKGDRLWEYALGLEELNRNAGKHAAAIVVDSQKELWHKTPIYTTEKMGGAMVTQYSMNFLEPVDLIKFDFLGLKTLTVVHDALELIKKRYGKEIDFLSVDVDDPKVYEVLQSGDTLGIFQIESSMFQGLIKRVKPSNFEEIIALIALGRPGPMESGMLDDFVDRKHGREPIVYAFDALEPILRPTYGTIVYQEQVMQIVQTIGGFSLGGADLVRRAMGKKIKEKMTQLKKEFLQGAEKNGFNRAKAEELWELIVKFAEYGFNKSHSAAYGMVTFQTAYLKTYYEHEFMAALLTSEAGKIETIAKYMQELKNMGIDMVPPHVNISDHSFGVGDFDEDGKSVKKVIFGLSAIKGVGDEPIANIVGSRESEGKYKNLEDFIARMDFSKVTKRVMEPLIKSGALDGLGYSRACMMENIDKICDAGRSKDKVKEMMANSLFGESNEEVSVRFDFQDIPEYGVEDLLEFEFECMGIYVSGHPLEADRETIQSVKGVVESLHLEEVADDTMCYIIGKVIKLERKTSKSGKTYDIARILDLGSQIELMVFEKQAQKLKDLRGKDDYGNFRAQDEVLVAYKCKVEKDEERLGVRLFDVMDLAQAKEQELEIEWADKNYDPDEIIPIAIKIHSATDSCVFANLAKSAKTHKGNRELRILIEGEQEGYMFVSKFRVDDSIKEDFPEFEWVDWK